MDGRRILRDNCKAENGSFLYYLHEENVFHQAAFSDLCECIAALGRTHPRDPAVSGQVCFVYGQVLRHILYHFDPDDLSRISNLPRDYGESLQRLERAIAAYFAS